MNDDDAGDQEAGDDDDARAPASPPASPPASNIVRLPTPKERRKLKARNVTLCRHGHHKWAVVDTPFDVAAGKLITRYRCTRCGQERNEAR